MTVGGHLAVKEKYPHVNKANKYARDVVAGRIPACKWVKAACQRHLDDLKREKDADYPFKFDRLKAEKYCQFAEKMPHVKGDWAKRKELIVFQPWQCFIWCCVYGWLRKKDDLRRFREVYAEIPRKNSKSIQSAIAGHYMFTSDGEIGAEVYSGATSEKQAWEVFGPARQMALQAKGFKDFFDVEINAKTLSILRTNSKFEPIIGKPGDGASPTCAIVDEYHEHQTPDLYDTMLTGMGARFQPLQVVITTAGWNLGSPCYDKRDQVCKMLDGVIQNDELFGIIYTIDTHDDWTDFAVWKKANPNFGISVFEDYLKARLLEATQRASRQNIIRCKHLNQWMSVGTAFFNMKKWADCADPALQLSDFEGERCWIAIDLASKIDIAAKMRLFKREIDGFYHYYIFGSYYLPEAAAEGSDKAHYQGWAKDGWITLTDGNRIDFEIIEEDLKEDAKTFEVVEVPHDPWGAPQFVTNMQKEGLTMVEVPQTVNYLSEPMKEMDALILDDKIHHNGDPVLTWMISNVVAKLDKKDNVFPYKERNESKIDGAVGSIMAIGRAISDDGGQSIYEERGFGWL